MEDGGVDVLAHLDEDEPVAVVALPQHGADVVAVHGLAAVDEEQVADVPGERLPSFKFSSDWFRCLGRHGN